LKLVGRALHQGQPRAGVIVRLSGNLGKEKNRFFAVNETKTDVEGRCRLAGLEAGDGYQIQFVDPDGMADPAWGIKSGTVPEGRNEVRLPDVQLISYGQTLRGVVVDPQGKPVAGISVSARLRNGRYLSARRSSSPWTTTDEQGRFELRQLPDQPLELVAFRRTPGGRRIRYPSVVRPAMNEQTVRIVFDSSLGKEVEDLDKPKRPEGM
jgi:hypothetical protein